MFPCGWLPPRANECRFTRLHWRLHAGAGERWGLLHEWHSLVANGSARDTNNREGAG